MSFARAFSKRRTQRDITPPSSPLKRQSASVSKHQISSPVELISTTNMLSYTAPSLRTSLSNTSLESAGSPPPLTPDLGALTPPSTPPAEESPLAHKQTYFIPRSASVYATTKAPEIPAVSLKRAHTMSLTPAPTPTPPPKSPSRSLSVSSSHSLRPSRNPFGPELAKVSELAEEMGLNMDRDEEYMSQHGLMKYSVQDYLAEVEDITWGPQSTVWI